MVISSIRLEYPNYYSLHIQMSFCTNQGPSFGGILLLRTHLQFTHLLSDMHTDYRGVQEDQAGVPLYYGNTMYIWHREWGRRERKQHGKERIWNDRLPFWELSQVPSSLVSVSCCGEGQSERQPSLGLSFMLPITTVVGIYITWAVR